MKVKSIRINEVGGDQTGYIPLELLDPINRFQTVTADLVGVKVYEETLKLLHKVTDGAICGTVVELILVTSISDDENMYMSTILESGVKKWEADFSDEQDISEYVYRGLAKNQYDKVMAIREYMVTMLNKSDKELLSIPHYTHLNPTLGVLPERNKYNS